MSAYVEGYVNLKLPMRVWGRLVSEADRRGTNAEEMVATLIEQTLTLGARAVPVFRMIHEGLTDTEIVQQLGEPLSYVRDVRRRAGHAAAISRERMSA